MENYDLSTITRDNLHFLLTTAKKELVKYTNCKEDIERCERGVEEEKQKLNEEQQSKLGRYMGYSVIISGICTIMRICSSPERVENEGGEFVLGSWLIAFGIVAAIALLIYFSKLPSSRKRIKASQNNIKKYETELVDLRKKKEEAMNEFKAVLFIPDDYCYEYALTKMLKFIDNRQADNWKEVTGLYEEHLHRMTMEDNARQTLEQSKMQAEYAREGRDAARWAAAGTWATAAGVWRR